MKSYIQFIFGSVILTLLGIFPLGVFADWTVPERLDSAQGAYATLSYAPDGDLLVFYGIIEGATEKMVVRIRRAGENTFGAETFVYNGGRALGIHYGGGGVIDLAVSNGGLAVVLQSNDDGQTWNFRTSYSGGNSTHIAPNYNPSAFTDDGTELRLIYGYELDSGVVGSSARAYTVKRIGVAWDASGPLIGPGVVKAAYEAGEDVCLVTDRGVYHSADNGSSYDLTDGEYLYSQLRGEDAQVSGSRVYLLHNYTYGVGPNDKHLKFTYSDDACGSWYSPQIPIISGGVSYMITPRFAIDNASMVAVWQHAEDIFNNREIKVIMSTNGGASWGPVNTLQTLAGNNVMVAEDPLDIASYDRKVTVAYAVRNSNTRSGVYLTEYALPAGADCIPGDTCDNTAPVLSDGSPSGILAAGTQEVTLSVATDEFATCRYAAVADTAFGSMTDTFLTTGERQHSTLLSGLSSGSHTYYIRCQDGSLNATATDYTVSFTIANAPADPADPGQDQSMVNGTTPYLLKDGQLISLASQPVLYIRTRNLALQGKYTAAAGGYVQVKQGRKLLKKIRIDGVGNWAGTIRAKTNKKYSYRFIYVNTQNQPFQASNNFNIMVDTQRPKITNRSSYKRSVMQPVILTVKDKSPIATYSFVFSYNNQSQIGSSRSFIIPAGTPPGVYTLQVQASDAAGNTGSKRIRIRVR